MQKHLRTVVVYSALYLAEIFNTTEMFSHKEPEAKENALAINNALHIINVYLTKSVSTSHINQK